MDADVKKQDQETARFKAALKAIRKKGVTARVVLDTCCVPPTEALPTLRSGWEQVLAAVAILKSRFEAIEQGVPESETAKLDALGTLAATRIDALTALLGEPSSSSEGTPAFSGREGLKHTRELDRAGRTLNALWRRYVASPIARTLHKARVGALIVCATLVVGLLSVGLYYAVTYPALDEGLSATYFTRQGFKGIRFVIVDHQINFAWGNESPLKGVGRDHFSVIWEGCLIVDKGADARLVAGADDGVRVYIENEKVIDIWDTKGYQRSEADRVLSPGIYPIKVEYVEKRGDAQVFLGWSLSDGEMEVVPFKNLVPKTTGPGFASQNKRCPKRAEKF